MIVFGQSVMMPIAGVMIIATLAALNAGGSYFPRVTGIMLTFEFRFPEGRGS